MNTSALPIAAQVEHHLCENLRRNKVQTEPYPHVYIENFFPDEFYCRLLENLPSDTQYQLSSGARTGNPLAHTHRRRFYFTAKEMEVLANRQAECLRDLYRVVNSTAFTQEMIDLFRAHFGLRPDLNSNTALKLRTELVRDEAGYGIGPHTDSPNKLITLLVYLPEQEIPQLGTSVYTPKEAGFTSWNSEQFDYSDYNRHFTVPYKPNSAFAFLKTDNSFHGVEVIDQPGVCRDLLNWQIMVSKAV